MADPHDFDPGDLEESLAGTPSRDPVLPFDWKTLPHEPVGFRGYRARKEKSEWCLTLARGRVIHLYSLRQVATDAGEMTSSPRGDSGFNERLVKSAIRSLARDLDCEEGDIAVLPPLLLRSIEKRPLREPGPAEAGVDYLPPVRTLAVFDSSPVSDPEATFSTLAVLWFQNRYGPPEGGYVTEQLRQLDWDRLAKDGSW
jgi:hypothetical protein